MFKTHFSKARDYSITSSHCKHLYASDEFVELNLQKQTRKNNKEELVLLQKHKREVDHETVYLSNFPVIPVSGFFLEFLPFLHHFVIRKGYSIYSLQSFHVRFSFPIRRRILMHKTHTFSYYYIISGEGGINTNAFKCCDSNPHPQPLWEKNYMQSSSIC